MSMPSYWFDPMVNAGPLGGLGGNAATGQPAMSADQINASMGMGPGGAGAQNQAVLNNNFNNFGTLTDYYSSLGASYGRATGGFGGEPGRVGTISNPGTSNPGYLSSASYSPFVSGAPPVNHYGGFNNSQIFDPQRYLQQNPDVWQHGATPWEHYNQYGRNEGRQGAWSDIFNSKSYLQNNPDVAAAGADPTAHWFQYGRNEGREGQIFDPNQYLSQNRDVWEAGADPWQHYSQFGEKEGRQGAWDKTFNPQAYLQQNPDVAAAGVDPTAHWFTYGQKEGRQGNWGDMPEQAQRPATDWNDFFNRATAGGGGANTSRDALAAGYYLGNQDVYDAAKRSGGDLTDYAFNHLMNYGDDEKRRFFDANAYLQQNPDVWQAGANPFQHYNQYGQKEGRAAPLSGTFDARWYGEQNPDVLAAGMDPTAHWLQYGRNEGREGGATFNTSGYKDPWAAGIPQGRNNRDVLAAVLAASQSTGLHPNALSALFGVESVWDPRSNSPGNPNWGVPQLSADMWGDSPFNGVINGKTWEQYKAGTAADQIGVFADWLNRSGSMTRGGLDFAAQPPEMQFALLMANQLGGHYGMDWRNRIAAGDMTTPVYQGRAQAGELGTLSPADLIGAYDKRVARWPTQQTNWGP